MSESGVVPLLCILYHFTDVSLHPFIPFLFFLLFFLRLRQSIKRLCVIHDKLIRHPRRALCLHKIEVAEDCF